jgi:hypothetical protein
MPEGGPVPTSQSVQISRIVDMIQHIDPQSVLDIGPGFGKYGLLCREYLEVFHEQESYGKFTRRIDAIEVFPDYLTPVHHFVYNDIMIGNAVHIVPTLKHRYDLTLLIDVLEHFTKEDGSQLLKDIMAHSRNLIVSVPKDIGEQGEVYHNTHETHLAEWNAADLTKLGAGFVAQDMMSFVAFFGESALVDKLGPKFNPGPARRIKRALLNTGT